MFPALTAQQRARVLAHGRSRKVQEWRNYLEPNAQGIKSFVVVAGRLELLLLSDNKEKGIVLCGPAMFTGELNGPSTLRNGIKMGLRWWRDVLIRNQTKRYLDGAVRFEATNALRRPR